MTAPRREPRLSESELPQIRFDDERRHDRGRKQTPKVTAERRRVRAAIPIAVGALALLAVVGYLFRDQLTGGGRPDAPATRVQTSAPAQTVVAKPSEPEPQNVPTAVATSQPDTAAQERAARLETLAADANAAYAAGRLTGTDGDSAAEAYRAMIEIDSENEIAKTGLAQLATGLTAAAENALAAGQVDVASSAINQLSVVDPEATALPQLQASLQRVQEQRSKDLEVYQLLASAKEDYEAGRIIEPEGENALEKYREVESLRPGMGAVKKAYIDIGNFLIEQADQASSEERFDDAYRYLDTAKSILPDRPEIDDARQYVDNRKVTYDLKQRRQAQQ
jgi:tetratricopeptide (TPR) repeat protein